MTEQPSHMDLITHSYEIAKTTIEAGGEELPHYVLFNDKGEVTILACPWGGEEEKRKTVQVAKLVALRHRTTSLLFVSETWVSEISKGQKRPPGMPRDDPNRKEMLMMVSVTREGSTHFRAEITRGPTVVGPLCPWTDGETVHDNIAAPVLPPANVVNSMTDAQLEMLDKILGSWPGAHLEEVVHDGKEILH